MHSEFFQRLLRLDRLLLVKAIVSLFLLVYLAPNLLPDEAQYWVWSQRLDIGYYSKPAGIAWLIALSTSLFGDMAWVVRLPSIFLAWLGAYYVRRGLKVLGYSEAISRASACLMIFCPLMLFGSFCATTDVGLIAAWCALLCYLVDSTASHRFWKLAASSFLGMLFKPTLLVLIPMQLLRPRMTESAGVSRLRDVGAIALGCFLALLLFVYWNAQHDWVTLRHIWEQLFGKAVGEPTSIVWKRPFDYILTQGALLSPYLAWLMLKSMGVLNKKPDEAGGFPDIYTRAWMLFFMRSSLLVLLWVVFASPFIKYQANWIAFIYPHLFYLLAIALHRMGAQRATKIMQGHALIHSSLLMLVLYISLAQTHPHWPLSGTPWKINAFRPAIGWEKVQQEMAELPFDRSQGFFVSDKYQTVSQLAFCLQDMDVYWFNLHGARKNQFSFWSVPEGFKGKPAFFVAVENEPVEEMKKMAFLYRSRLEPYFSHVGEMHVHPLVEGKDVRSLLWIKLEGYLGNRPSDPHSF